MTSSATASILAQINRASSLCNKGNHKEASLILGELPSLLINDREVRTRLGQVFIALGDFSNAEVIFRHLDERYPAR